MATHFAQTKSDFLEEAFEKFAKTIRPSDDRLFRNTTLEDVRTAALIIERDQRQRRCQRNLRRIEPLLDALRRLGIALEPLSNGVPYLCYIWAPLKLLLQIADEYTKGFEQLLDAYAQIARHMPRFDRLTSAFQSEPDFIAVLADVYSDILEFHSNAYSFLRRSGWKHLFDSAWKSFGTRFNAILQRLARGRDLIDKEAVSFDLLQAKEFRQSLMATVEKQELDRRDWQLRDSISWLDLKGQDLEQEELFEQRVRTREPSTCEWLLHHAKILTWLDEDDPRHFLWLQGKPGSGKTTLASFLIEQGSFPHGSTVVYCLCTYGFGKMEKNACNLALRSILAQIIRQNLDILGHVYDKYVKSAFPPSGSRVQQALREVLGFIGSTFLVIDGLDECESAHQTQLLQDLMQITKPADWTTTAVASPKLKVLICSRETKEIKQKLSRQPTLSLYEEKDNVSKDISTFTKKSLRDLTSRFSRTVIDRVANEIVKRADGMFLWVHLVIGTLLDQESEYDLCQALKNLPKKLPDVYKCILMRLDQDADQHKTDRINQILGCLTFAIRPLRTWEVCDLIVLHGQDGIVAERTKLGVGALDICKPLIEEREGQVISLVHFSVREFLLHTYSGPRLVESRIQMNMTAACIRYLLTCRYFEASVVSSEQYGCLVKGYDDLFPYIFENWLEHLQICFRSISADAAKSSPFTDVTRLLSRLTSKIERSVNNDSEPSSQQQANCLVSSTMPAAIEALVGDRRNMSRSQRLVAAEDLETPANVGDGSVTLSIAYKCFQQAFESILSDTCPFTSCEMGVEEEQIRDFKVRHGHCAFLCRYSGCVRASNGFSDSLKRLNHEKSHRPQYRCDDPACGGADGTFNTKMLLKRHTERHHKKILANEQLPNFPIRRANSIKRSMRTTEPNPSLTDQIERIKLPEEQFFDHMRPQLRADNYPADQINDRISIEWHKLSFEHRTLWYQRYEDMVADLLNSADTVEMLLGTRFMGLPTKPKLPNEQFHDYMRPRLEAEEGPTAKIEERINQEWAILSVEDRDIWERRYEKMAEEYACSCNSWKALESTVAAKIAQLRAQELRNQQLETDMLIQ